MVKCGKRLYSDRQLRCSFCGKSFDREKVSLNDCPICCAPIPDDAKECFFCGAEFHRNFEGEIFATDYDEEIDKQLSKHYKK